MGGLPFSVQGRAVTIRAQARKLPDWRTEDGVAAPPRASPAASAEALETILLVPYASTKLRITSFPHVAG